MTVESSGRAIGKLLQLAGYVMPTGLVVRKNMPYRFHPRVIVEASQWHDSELTSGVDTWHLGAA